MREECRKRKGAAEERSAGRGKGYWEECGKKGAAEDRETEAGRRNKKQSFHAVSRQATWLWLA